MIEIKAYQCEYGCRKYLKTKRSMKEHEKECMWNPKKRACISCGHNKHYTDSDDFQNWEGCWCEKLEFEIFNDKKYNGRNNCFHWIKK